MENSMRKNKNVLIITSIAPILTEKGSFKFAHITQFRNEHNSIYHSDAPSILKSCGFASVTPYSFIGR